MTCLYGSEYLMNRWYFFISEYPSFCSYDYCRCLKRQCWLTICWMKDSVDKQAMKTLSFRKFSPCSLAHFSSPFFKINKTNDSNSTIKVLAYIRSKHLSGINYNIFNFSHNKCPSPNHNSFFSTTSFLPILLFL